MTLDLHPHRWFPATMPGLPTLVLLHGTGGNEDSLVDVGAKILPGAARLSPRGLVLEHGMPRFFRRFAEGQFDLEDLAARTVQLHGWLRAALAHYAAGDAPIAFVGYSNGANMAASLLLHGDLPPASAVLLRPMLVHRPAVLPSLAGTRVLLTSGARDQITPAPSAAALGQLLQDAGATVEQVTHDDAGHNLIMDDIGEAARFLRR